jgi:hypothetical protein
MEDAQGLIHRGKPPSVGQPRFSQFINAELVFHRPRHAALFPNVNSVSKPLENPFASSLSHKPDRSKVPVIGEWFFSKYA